MNSSSDANNRRYIPWRKIRSFPNTVSFLIATALGAGLSPVAPGTAGSLLAIPLCWYTLQFGLSTQIFFWLALLAAGVWASKVLGELSGIQDHQSIVIDEVLGMAIATWGCNGKFPILALAFIFFRIFDTLKPFPVRWIDRLSKKDWQVKPFLRPWIVAAGVIGDDLVAGLQALAVVHLLFSIGWI